MPIHFTFKNICACLCTDRPTLRNVLKTENELNFTVQLVTIKNALYVMLLA